MSRHSTSPSPSGEPTDRRVSSSHRSELEYVSDRELDQYLASLDRTETGSKWNISTILGLLLIIAGTGLVVDQLGYWTGWGIGFLTGMLPWLAGIVILIVGFGILPKDRRKRSSQPSLDTMDSSRSPNHDRESSASRNQNEGAPSVTGALRNLYQAIQHAFRKRRLTRSNNSKLLGVCGGLGEYAGIDANVIRLAFVVGTFMSLGTAIFLYLGLGILLPKEDKGDTGDPERVTVNPR